MASYGTMRLALVDEMGQCFHEKQYPIHEESTELQLQLNQEAEDGKLSLSLFHENNSTSSETFAQLLVRSPIVEFSTQLENVFTIPGYIHDLTSFPMPRSVKADFEQSAKLESANPRVVLRHNDVIVCGSHRILVSLTISPNEQVQVGSSDPTPQIAEGQIESVQHRSRNKKQPSLPEQLSNEIKVDRSIHIDGLGDSLGNRTPNAKHPVVQETPASRHRYIDAESNWDEQVYESLDAASKRVIGNSQKFSQVSCCLPLAAEDQQVSQELLGTANLARQIEFSEGIDQSLESRIEAITDSETAKVGTSTSDTAINGKTSTESESAFATAPTDQNMAIVEEKFTTESKVAEKRHKGKKRNSDEVEVDLVEEDRKTKRVATSKTKSSKETKSNDRPQEANQEPRTGTKVKDMETPKSTPDGAKRNVKSPRITFSNSSISPGSSMMKFLTSKGVKEVDKPSPRGFDMVVVGNGELKRTFKLLMAIALGKPVVTDSWIFDSAEQDQLLDPLAYVPQDSALEKHWTFTLAETTPQDRRNLFKGKLILITPALRKEYGKNGFKDTEELWKILGARQVISKPFENANLEKKDSGLLVIASEAHDSEARIWQDDGQTCYTKELMSVSILRGRLDLNDDKLKITPVIKKKTKNRSNKKAL